MSNKDKTEALDDMKKEANQLGHLLREIVEPRLTFHRNRHENFKEDMFKYMMEQKCRRVRLKLYEAAIAYATACHEESSS